MPNCKEVTRRVLISQDQALPWSQRAGMRVHWMMCAACANFRQQMNLMQKANARWRQYSEE